MVGEVCVLCYIYICVYSCYVFDLGDSCLEPGGEGGVLSLFVQNKCRYCGLRVAAYVGEGCGSCYIEFCV